MELSIECAVIKYVPKFNSSCSNKNSEFYSYISDYNEQDACNSHANMFHLLNKFFDSEILVCGMSIVWEDTNGCAKQYICELWLYI